MPEAAVDKNSDPLFKENKIWFAGQLGMPPPASDSVCPENGRQLYLGILISSRPDSRHYERALGLGENVNHDRA
jgi:hypothetical protein